MASSFASVPEFVKKTTYNMRLLFYYFIAEKKKDRKKANNIDQSELVRTLRSPGSVEAKASANSAMAWWR